MSLETPNQAALRLAARQLQQGFEFSALHEYTTIEGSSLYWRIRLKHADTSEKWIRPMSIEQGQFVLKEPVFEQSKPLYNLDRITQYPEEVVYVVEGEYCADKLTELGLIATTSGGSDSALKADWSVIANRNVIIWPDYDEAGNKYAEAVISCLKDLNCNVSIIDVSILGLKKKDDCVDWVKLNAAANKADIERLALLPGTSFEKETVLINSSLPVNFNLKNDGVYFCDPGSEDEIFICSRLEVTALVRNKSSECWGRLLEFYDADNKHHLWSMPMEMLKGSGEELRGELLRLGLEIAPGNKVRNLLLSYIIASKPIQRVCCVSRTGWHESVYVLPECSIGCSDERVVYQTEHQSKGFSQSGSLDEWKAHVSSLCKGNSRLILSVSCAFAAIVMHLVGAESGGLHFVGASSSGKTTALRVAASVCSAPDYLNRWRATTNGLEALAALRCDSLLILDELAQVDAKEAGEIAYMLANGSGKTRANRSGGSRSRYEWRLLFLSAGEIGLAQHMNDAGKKAKAGQEVRLIDINADANKGYGIFENLHGLENGSELSKRLLDVCSNYYGTPAISFLELITLPQHIKQLPKILNELRKEFINENLPYEASGQVSRVCDRFALIYAAGELATSYGVTGWHDGEAYQAVSTCFKEWLENRGGTGNQEEKAILVQVKSFFEQHGNSRFSDWNDINPLTHNRAGIRKRENLNESVVFYVLPEAFRTQICVGFEPRQVTKVLINAGWIEPEASGASARRETLPGIGRTRCYVFNNKMWED